MASTRNVLLPVSYLLDTQASVHLHPANWSVLVGSAYQSLMQSVKPFTITTNWKPESLPTPFLSAWLSVPSVTIILYPESLEPMPKLRSRKKQSSIPHPAWWARSIRNIGLLSKMLLLVALVVHGED